MEVYLEEVWERGGGGGSRCWMSQTRQVPCDQHPCMQTWVILLVGMTVVPASGYPLLFPASLPCEVSSGVGARPRGREGTT